MDNKNINNNNCCSTTLCPVALLPLKDLQAACQGLDVKCFRIIIFRANLIPSSLIHYASPLHTVWAENGSKRSHLYINILSLTSVYATTINNVTFCTANFGCESLYAVCARSYHLRDRSWKSFLFLIHQNFSMVIRRFVYAVKPSIVLVPKLALTNEGST